MDHSALKILSQYLARANAADEGSQTLLVVVQPGAESLHGLKRQAIERLVVPNLLFWLKTLV